MVGIYKQRARELPTRRGRSTDEWVRGEPWRTELEERARKNEGKKRSDEGIIDVPQNRGWMRMQIFTRESSRRVKEPAIYAAQWRGPRNSGILERSNFAMGSALCLGD